MSRQTRYSPEVRERAVRMVLEHQREYESQWAAIGSIAAKIGCTRETLRKWVRRAEVDQGVRGGVKGDERCCFLDCFTADFPSYLTVADGRFRAFGHR